MELLITTWQWELWLKATHGEIVLCIRGALTLSTLSCCLSRSNHKKWGFLGACPCALCKTQATRCWRSFHKKGRDEIWYYWAWYIKIHLLLWLHAWFVRIWNISRRCFPKTIEFYKFKHPKRLFFVYIHYWLVLKDMHKWASTKTKLKKNLLWSKFLKVYHKGQKRPNT
jgi:hypothetical protein